MLLSHGDLKAEFTRVLLKHNVPEAKAEAVAGMFADTTETGVFSHGVNRFPKFIKQLAAGDIVPEAEPERLLSLGALEQWTGNMGFGNLNARQMMDRAMALADEYGIGMTSLRDTNHWMRGGSYGWQAAEKGYVGICWSTALAMVPPWGGTEKRLGTNPIIIAVPGNPPTMIDMSTTMFSYGMLEVYRLAGKELPVDGGYDEAGNLTRDPAAIERTHRILPMGFWKGSGLSIVLDMIAALTSGGLTVREFTQQHQAERAVCQVFIAIALDKLVPPEERNRRLAEMQEWIQSSERVNPEQEIRMPCHEFPAMLEKHRKNGIPVDDGVWAAIKAL